MSTELTLKRFTGSAILPYIPALARLRIEVFRDFPYLYEGSLDYEANYLRRYAASPHSVVVIAQDGNEVVGASTGLPLSDEAEEVKAPFLAQGLDVSMFFYCGESVLLVPYRGRGVGHPFFLRAKCRRGR